MHDYAPIARILLRYGVGATVGLAQGEMLAADPDIVTVCAVALGALVEALYIIAKKKGWAT